MCTDKLTPPHTPGPWFLDQVADEGPRNKVSLRVLVRSRTPEVATVFARPSSEESEANARLIAAAPSLLNACELALKDLEDLDAKDGMCPSLDALKNAIAKATGKVGPDHLLRAAEAILNCCELNLDEMEDATIEMIDDLCVAIDAVKVQKHLSAQDQDSPRDLGPTPRSETCRVCHRRLTALVKAEGAGCTVCRLEGLSWDAVGDILVKEFPQARYGDVSPKRTIRLVEALKDMIDEWISNNVPNPSDDDDA